MGAVAVPEHPPGLDQAQGLVSIQHQKNTKPKPPSRLNSLGNTTSTTVKKKKKQIICIQPSLLELQTKRDVLKMLKPRENVPKSPAEPNPLLLCVKWGESAGAAGHFAALPCIGVRIMTPGANYLKP